MGDTAKYILIEMNFLMVKKLYLNCVNCLMDHNVSKRLQKDNFFRIFISDLPHHDEKL